MSDLSYEASRVMNDAQQADRYLRLAFRNEAEWERAKIRFAKVKKSYTHGLTPGSEAFADAETKASGDPRVKKAVGDTAYYRAEMLAYLELYRLTREF